MQQFCHHSCKHCSYLSIVDAQTWMVFSPFFGCRIRVDGIIWIHANTLVPPHDDKMMRLFLCLFVIILDNISWLWDRHFFNNSLDMFSFWCRYLSLKSWINLKFLFVQFEESLLMPSIKLRWPEWRFLTSVLTLNGRCSSFFMRLSASFSFRVFLQQP